MSIVISASSANAVSDNTGAVAAVVEVFSLAFIVILVDKIVDPPSLTSTVSTLPFGAVVTLARIAVRVNAYGIRNVAFAVPVVNAVVSSLAAIIKACVFAAFAIIDNSTAPACIVDAAVTLPDPSKLGEVQTMSPVIPIVLPVANAVAVAELPVQLADDPVVDWFNVGKVQFVNVPLAGVPNAGVTNVGLVPNTKAPLPVSSEILPANSADVDEAKSLILLVVSAVFAL